jgi:predicted glutamine amidotransferase
MCRLSAFPPRFPQEKALEILLEMMGTKNIDGAGFSYVGADGNFVCKKWPTSLEKLMEKGTPFLEHMAGEGHNGWTIAHLRAASHGVIASKNTHPFIINDQWAFAQNGTWNDYNIVKLALSKTVKFEGETDTEVAGHLFAIGGAREFCQTMNTAGVFLGLRKDGALYVVKTSGLLEFNEFKDGTFLASSDLKRVDYPESGVVGAGWYYFNKLGKLIKSGRKETSYTNATAFHSTGYAGDKWLPPAYKKGETEASELTSRWEGED